VWRCSGGGTTVQCYGARSRVRRRRIPYPCTRAARVPSQHSAPILNARGVLGVRARGGVHGGVLGGGGRLGPSATHAVRCTGGVSRRIPSHAGVWRRVYRRCATEGGMDAASVQAVCHGAHGFDAQT